MDLPSQPPAKRVRRNAIRPNSIEADCIREVAINFQLSAVSIEDDTKTKEAAHVAATDNDEDKIINDTAVIVQPEYLSDAAALNDEISASSVEVDFVECITSSNITELKSGDARGDHFQLPNDNANSPSVADNSSTK